MPTYNSAQQTFQQKPWVAGYFEKFLLKDKFLKKSATKITNQYLNYHHIFAISFVIMNLKKPFNNTFDIKNIELFLNFILTHPKNEQSHIIELSSWLNKLDLIYLGLKIQTNTNSNREFDTLTSEKISRKIIENNFPFLGLYNCIDSLNVLGNETNISISDGVDDLLDISNELQEVLSRFNINAYNGAWYFSFSYKAHWGEHLQNLRYYLALSF